MKKAIIYSLLLFPCIVFAVTTNVSKVAFTTDARTVDPGILSEAITIQTQNSGDAEEKLDSTADVIFTSSSATGEFLGSTGKAVTKTMSSGSANKTFYYKDSAVGTHTISVQVNPRTGGSGWSATQKIYVGVENDEPVPDESATTTTTTTNSEKKSYSSSKKLSTYKKPQILKMSAGRNRTVLVNTPIYFEAETNLGERVKDAKIDFMWSYGDGDSDSGIATKHIYYFPGDYHVVLTARKGKDESVSMIKVKVLDNLLGIAKIEHGVNGYVEIENKASSEANINGWEIVSGKNKYMISGDTIIDAKKSLRIPNKVLHFDPGDNVDLMFPTREIAYSYSYENPIAKIPEAHREDVSFDIDADQVALPADIPEPAIVDSSTIKATTSDSEKVKQVAAVVESKPRGFWGFVKSLLSVE
jgi:hypothetical protein